MASRARGMSLSKTIRPCNRLITGGPVESRENPHDLYVSVCRELENMRDAVPVLDLILRDSPRVLEQFALVDPESQALRSVRPTSPLVRQFQREMQELLRLTRQLPEIGGGTISDEQQEWLETLNHYLQEAFRHLPVENQVGMVPYQDGEGIKLVAYPRIKGLNQLCMVNYITHVISKPRAAEQVGDCLYCGLPFIRPRPNTVYCCTQCRDTKNSKDSQWRRAAMSGHL